MVSWAEKTGTVSASKFAVRGTRKAPKYRLAGAIADIAMRVCAKPKQVSL